MTMNFISEFIDFCAYLYHKYAHLKNLQFLFLNFGRVYLGGEKKMKTKKKVITLGMSLLILCGTISTVWAYTYKMGTEYQTVTHKDIPGWGDAHRDTNYGSKKTMTSQIATFKKTKGDAALGNYAELIDSSKTPKSNMVGIPLNRALIASEHGCSKGKVYFTAVASHTFEPSNTCDVTLKFSADDLI